MSFVAIVYFSGYGHTAKQAEAVAADASVEEAPRNADLETAKQFGKRVAELARKLG
jgi:flavodoxin